ncbi:NAD(P)H-hydrate epimerase [Leptospira sp. 96542]|nr:NAD(P)H-hydrate epimerase [Leptospira sp. 96542]
MKFYPLFDSEESKELDKVSSQDLGYNETTLMGMAAVSVYHANEDLWSTANSIFIVCGTGGNGGDGYALAQILFQEGHSVFCFGETPTKQKAAEFYHSLCQKTGVKLFSLSELTTQLDKNEDESVLLVDAILGIGFKPPLKKNLDTIIQLLNDHPSIFYTIALDTPSGWACEMDSNFIIADSIEELGTRKWENIGYIHESGSVIPRYYESIGFPTKTHTNLNNFSRRFYLEPDLEGALQTAKRKTNDHKYSAGSAVFYGGDSGMEGAILLSERAFSALGGGISKIGSPSLQIQNLVLKDDLSKMAMSTSLLNFLKDPFCAKTKSILVGPGLTEYPKELEGYRFAPGVRLVLDAGAIPKSTDSLPFADEILLTPHTGEFYQMTGFKTGSIQSAYKPLKEYCKKNQVNVLLKSYVSLLMTKEEEVFVWESPNPRLSVMGSGDLLAGIIIRYFALGLPVVNSVHFALSLLEHSREMKVENPSAHQILNSMIGIL